MPKLAALLLASVFAAAPALAADAPDLIHVTIDQAKLVKAPAGVATLVIGNPMIADVTMLKNGVGMIVTGKGYGQTNLIAIDGDGKILEEKQLRVEPGDAVLVVQRGDQRSSYACNPTCMPTVQLGDDDKVFSAVGGQMQTRNSLAAGAAAAK